MKKILLTIFLIISLILTGYKYYFNYIKNDNLINYFKSIEKNNEITFNIKDLIWDWNLNYREKLSVIWKEYIKFNRFRIYTNNYKKQYPLTYGKLETWLIYDYKYKEVDWKKHLIFISLNLDKKRYKNTKNYSYINWLDDYDFKDFNFSLLTKIRDKNSNNELIKWDIRLISELNENKNFDKKELLLIKTVEIKNTVYITEAVFKKLSKLEKIKVNNCKQALLNKKEEEKEMKKEFRSLFHSKNEKKIKDLLETIWLKYIKERGYSQNLKKIEKHYQKEKLDINYKFLGKFNL